MSREDGFTLVEVLVAILILASGSIAVLGTFDASARNTFRAEQSQVAINRAQRELEQIRQLSYDEVGLTTTPAHVSDPKDPRYRVSGNNFALGWDGTTASNYGEMVVRNVGSVTTGSINPGPTPFVSGDVSGKVYRFVVWQNDPSCPTSGVPSCPGPHDYKRVVVVVTLDTVAVSYARTYTEMGSNFSDPDANSLSEEVPGGGGILTAQQFFLSDTPCSQSTPEPPSSEHDTHNTLGACGGGPNTPDGLYTSAPPDPDPNDPSNPALFDYAIDPLLEPTPDGADRGLQMLRQDTNDCNYSGGSGNEYFKVHRWVSQPMPINFVMSGQATFKFFTRTIGDVSVPGGICVWLFTRTESSDATPVVTDSALINLDNPPQAYFTFSKTPWDKGQWTDESLVMHFSSITLTQGKRLGVAIGIHRNDTPQNALQFMYDHPDEPSRLEVKTTTPLP